MYVANGVHDVVTGRQRCESQSLYASLRYFTLRNGKRAAVLYPFHGILLRGILVSERCDRIYQVNLWDGFGGSEVYTRFLSIALQTLGYRTTVFVNAKARHWDDLDFGAATLVPIADPWHIFPHLPTSGALILTNFPLRGEVGALLKRDHRVVTFAHQPLYDKDLRPYDGSHLVVANSQHVLRSVAWAGLPCYPDPLYGVADVARLRREGPEAVFRNSHYAWDRHKVRDTLLSWLEPAWRRSAKPERFEQRDGLTLGIVSRLTTIKQFPKMFHVLAPIIARHRNVWIEIFGSGSYASVRDLKESLRSVRDRVRFWGQQKDVRSVYTQLDFLLSGLPEREGMGRNVIEAQLCGTPVLAVNAPPFTETVVDGVTGYLFADPRRDRGRDFEQVLARIAQGGLRPDPTDALEHLYRFTQPAFNTCIERLLHRIDRRAAPAEVATVREEPRSRDDRTVIDALSIRRLAAAHANWREGI